MKNKLVIRLLCMLLISALFLSACGSSDEPEEKTDRRKSEQNSEEDITSAPATGTESTTPAVTDEVTPEPVVTDEPTPEPTAAPQKKSYFSSVGVDSEKLIADALEQYNAHDYTNLDEPVKYYVLWLGFTHVTYEGLDFQMTDFDREYLQAVAYNFEKCLESITQHNLDITVELHFLDEETPLTKWYNDNWLFLEQGTVQPVIDEYIKGREFDTVLTTVQTAGDENYLRNADKDNYGVNYVMLGLMTAGMNSEIGYSTFDLGKPAEGTYPLEDPEIPSLYATSVAVHEWMHQLEYIGTLLGIEYPNTHAYMGPGEFPGYKQYINGENDYDFFEFYKLVLTGKLPYNDGTGEKLVGMYPKMWPLIKRDRNNLGYFTIKAKDGSGYLTARTSEPVLVITKEPCVWHIKYDADGRFILTPAEMPEMLIDLNNAWDIEDNSIGLHTYTGYVNAQSWKIIDSEGGSYSIQTPYDSGRILTVRGAQGALLCSDGTEGVQDWYIEFAHH